MQNLPNNLFGSIDDFIISEDSKPLGSGSFGVVKKAWHKLTNKIYAIKIISMDQHVNESQILLLMRQISIHYQLSHPHIIKLWAVLEQNDKVYMIMDYAQNGNLFNHLNKKKVFTEAQSFKIFFQVLDAIEYMHKIDTFHRDIKPENILLDHQLNIKLCDFGWVADQINRKRTTFCGTYQYMAPEMVRDIPYDYKIDIWALGILLYELNHGKAPFPAQSASMIKQKFQKGVYQVKQTLSQQLKYLIAGILQFDPKNRFQIQDIKKSDWVKKFKSQNLQIISMNSIMRNLASSQENHRSNSNTFKTFLKQDKNNQENRQKKYRKKHRTLQEEDLYCMTQNLKVNNNYSSNKQSQKTYQLYNENFNRQKYTKDHNIKQKDVNKIQRRQNEKKDMQNKRKKNGSTRTHLRTGTQTSQLLQKKLSKIVFHQKLKLFADDRKKKQSSKRT